MNNQNVEPTLVSSNRTMDEESVGRSHSGIQLSLRGGNLAVFYNMDAYGGHYSKENKPATER